MNKGSKMSEVEFTVKYNNPIVNAYKSGRTGVVLNEHPSNPIRLHRFKNKYNVDATGKNVGGKYVIVFWKKYIEKEVA